MNAERRASYPRVWDLFVRTFHWSLVALFLAAYLSEGEPLWLHTWAGYGIATLLVLRLLWGLFGPRHARFADFIYRPSTALLYLRGLFTGEATRYLGHSPAGGAMVVALMLALAGTVGSGMAFHAVRNNAGPLAGLIVAVPAAPAAGASDERPSERRRKPGGTLKEIHEILANMTLILVFLHLGGVLVASISHRENLARAMIDGRKRPLDD